MATVTLLDLWLNDAANPSDAMAFSYAGDTYTVTESLGGGVEGGYASGRTRLYSTDDDVTTVPLSLQWVTAAQRAWLKAHRGRVVCFRDPRGLKVFAGYHELPVEFSTLPLDMAIDNAQITLHSVTYSEAT